MTKLRVTARRTSLLVATTVVVGLVAPAAAAAPSMRERLARRTFARSAHPGAVNCGGLEQVSLETLHVQMKPQKKQYAIGETARIDVTVHRTLPQNPGNTGIRYDSPYREPAPEVSVGVGLRVGESFLYGFGFTNAKGKDTVNIKIRSYAGTGTVLLTTFATKNIVTTVCARADEVGFSADPRAFRVTR